MPAISDTAPGKIILFGEHAVVYGRPAIAAPVTARQAKTMIRAEPLEAGGEVRVQAPALGLEAPLSDLPEDHPLGRALHLVLDTLGISRPPSCTVRVTATIPMASGLGSGAAVTIATLRAFATFLGHPLSPERVAELAFEVEKIHHGTPSGIDTAVINYNQPIYYRKGQKVQILTVPQPFQVVIADSGVPSPTVQAVHDVRRHWQADRPGFERLFDAVGGIVERAREAILRGEIRTLGPLMDDNQELLARMGVSSPELDRLIESARSAGALGAKLSGGGQGGHLIALAAPGDEGSLIHALEAAGASGIIRTWIRPQGSGEISPPRQTTP